MTTIEINTARDPAIELIATVFAKPDLYPAAANAGFRLHHLWHLPSRCTEIMRHFARAFGRTEDWESVAIEFRQRDPGFFRWLDAHATPVDAEHINELVAELIAAANRSLNGTTGPLSNGGSVGTAYTSSDKPLASELTEWTTLTYFDAAGAVCTAMASDNAKIEHLPGIRRMDPETGLAEPEPPAASSGAESQSKPRDINDFHVEHGADAVRGVFDKAVTEDLASTRSSLGHDESGKSPNKRNAVAVAAALAGIKTATTLQTMKFPLLKYIVPGLIVEGCVLLAGKPKAGKSWFSYDVALAVASGRFCLGDKKCEQGDVLYLALEDNDRRLQSRATKLLPTFAGIWPERFNFQTQWPRANEGGIEAIDQWCEAHPGARLVVIDVLAAFRAPSTNKTNAYDQDYAAVSQLQKLAARRAITIIIVHHTRKGISEDPVEEISGTLGLGGGVDAFLILKRKGSSGTLIGRGRDIEDHDLGLQFSKETCRWTILGEAADVQRSEQRARVLVALENAAEGLSTTEIVSHAHLTSRAAADVLLSEMAKDGQIERVKRGVYALPGTKIAKQDKKGDEYGEDSANDHTRPDTRPSNESKAQGEATHTPDPPGHISVIEFLRWALTPDRRLVSDIEASARAEGLLGENQRIDTKPFRAAKMILGVVVEREGFGPGSKVYWRLPDSPDQGSSCAQTDRGTAVQMPEPEGDGQ